MAIERVALLGYAPARVQRPREELTHEPRVSIVVPCYNYGHYLATCVDSVLSQPGVTVDILIIDDASPDGSAEVARRLADQDERIRTICHSRNRGHIATYNEGLFKAEGDYVLLLSADDMLAPGALRRATALMQAHPSVGLVYGFATAFGGDRPPPARTRTRSWTIWRGDRWLADRCVTARNPVRSPEAVMRTSVLRTVGGYRDDLPHGADFELWMRTASVSDVGHLGGVDQAHYRVHETNMHQSVFDLGRAKGTVRDLIERRSCFAAVLEGKAHVPSADRLLDRAYRTLAREALTLAIRSYEWGQADEWPIDELVAFSRETYPPHKLRGLHRALALRQRIGAPWSGRNPMFMAAGQLYNVRKRLEVSRWQRAGV
jgi:glycosyltransferase involved in cell wall biosynthesis